MGDDRWMEPFTLRSAAGLPADPPPLADTTLVIIDAQQEYTTGRLPLTGVDAAVGVIAGLLSAARDAGSPIVHVLHQGRPGGLFDPDGSGAPIAAVAPADGETIVHKTLPNAFAGTTLAEVLDTSRPVTIVGFMTHMCVSATTRSALDHGIDAVVVADACATRDLPGPTGGDVVAAADLHRAALAALADRFAIVTTGDRVLAAT